MNHQDIIKQLRIRALAHRIEAEWSQKLDRSLKIPTLILACILTTTSTITAVSLGVILPYANAIIAFIVASLNGVISALQTTTQIQAHAEACKSYERLHAKCVSKLFMGLEANGEEYHKIIREVDLELQSILNSAPVLSTSSEEKAELQVKQSERLMRVTPPASIEMKLPSINEIVVK